MPHTYHMRDANQFISEEKLLIKRLLLLLSARWSFKITICQKMRENKNYAKYKIGTCISCFIYIYINIYIHNLFNCKQY